MKTIILIFLLSPIALYADSPVEALGERLFKDTRFSQYFAMASQGDVNSPLQIGAPELEMINIYDSEVISPFKGEAMSCASCHMVDQALDIPMAGMRGYNDFSKLTLIPKRDDKKAHTLRNTPSLIGIGSKYARNRISHYDGEFIDHDETVLGNFAGRNMGWMPHEKHKALKNITKVLREDDGTSLLSQEFGGSYKEIFLSQKTNIASEFRLPKEFRFDIEKISDEDLIQKVILFVSTYMNSLDFATDEKGHYNGSPYDEFLKINNIPTGPGTNQSMGNYLAELIGGVKDLEAPKFVKARFYPTHKKSFQFEQKEFDGLKLFFNITKRSMCINCHLPPLFTDHQFHNIGTTQIEYDKLHGRAAFSKLSIPVLAQRKDNDFLLSRPTREDKKLVDLGVWNFFDKPNKQKITDHFRTLFCRQLDHNCKNEEILNHLIARFKTPNLRNLGHSAPYFHNGSAPDLEDTLRQYLEAGKLRKDGKLRNGANQLRMMTIAAEDIEPLAAFLEALNEDYD